MAEEEGEGSEGDSKNGEEEEEEDIRNGGGREGEGKPQRPIVCRDEETHKEPSFGAKDEECGEEGEEGH